MGGTATDLIERYKSEHTNLNDGLARLTEVLDRARHGVDAGTVVAFRELDRFLNRELLAHAEWEELTFYPAVGELIRRHGNVNEGMLIDHLAIVDRVKAFIELTRRIETGDRSPELIDRARILAYQIQALVEVHDRKEEDVYLALLRRHASDQDLVHALAIGDLTGHD
jgi:hemerythrin-like domain-containing protein